MRPAAVGVVFDETKTQVLLIKRNDVPVWVLPGGGIEEGESPEQAVVREVEEETGLQVEIIRKIAEYFPLNKLAKETHLFECRHTHGSLLTGSETSDLAFYPLSALPKNFFIVHQDWLQDALLNVGRILKKPIGRVTYSNVLLYFFRNPLQVLRFAKTRFWPS